MSYYIIEEFKNKKGKLIRQEILFDHLDLKRAEDLLYHALSHGHDAFLCDKDDYDYKNDQNYETKESAKIRKEMGKYDL